jgi:F0F1-type ATP synthase assembly protein I
VTPAGTGGPELPPRPSGPGIMEFAGLGALLTVCTLAGLGLGWLLDSVAGTLPVFLMIGLLVGIAVGALACRARVRRW